MATLFFIILFIRCLAGLNYTDTGNENLSNSPKDLQNNSELKPLSAACPQLLEPLGGSKTLTPFFDWTDVSETDVGYDLRVSQYENLSQPVIYKLKLSESHYQTAPEETLDNGTTYFWSVKVHGEQYCEIRWFTTL